MNNKAYIVKENFKAPFVVATGIAHKPQRVEYKPFRKGQIIKGEMKLNNGKPAFILVGGIVPVECKFVNELSQKEITTGGSNTENTSNASGGSEKQMNQVDLKPTNPKVKYIDAMLIGALVGAVAVHFAEKKGYIPVPDQKNKLYGALAGALLSWYIVYRQQANKKLEIKVKN